MGDPLRIFMWCGILIAADSPDEAWKRVRALGADYVEGDPVEDPEDSDEGADRFACARTGSDRLRGVSRWALHLVPCDEVLEVPAHRIPNLRTFGEGGGFMLWFGHGHELVDLVPNGWTCDSADL